MGTVGSQPALWEAAGSAHNLEEVKRLVDEEGIDVNCEGGQYASTPLQRAAFCHGNQEMMTFLIARGASLTHKSLSGNSAETYAGMKGNTEAYLAAVAAGGRSLLRAGPVAVTHEDVSYYDAFISYRSTVSLTPMKEIIRLE